ncbi:MULTISPECIES: fimbria/pilus outer membrane usher protein [Escherichia]|uniref:fimbria/pilus outer membrane usher protein n=1 Tax=Escherichia TaxID=561 RepID=UPI001824CDF4|nr:MULTISPECIES: fimbria/pilus outer membrane usher protein [Escherichia]MBB9841786.1 fimbrial biogenesis outer membrane usher protein [Escherichia coli]MBS9329540.1 fimbrial biogenesis outer membrane usher protein [Escherichia coli]MCZ9080038.1 fimbrial biogenesis outer membrane usher protein [Escherichia albertii]
MKANKILLLTLIISTSFSTSAEDYFDPSLLASDILDNQDIDLSAFTRPGGGLAGEREVSVYVNNTFYTRSKLNFRNNADGVLSPDFPGGFFSSLLANDPFKDNESVFSSMEFINAIPYSSVKFDQSAARVDVSIPQAHLSETAYLKSSPDSWDTGITALLADYRLSGSKNESSYYDSDNLYLSSALGFNIAGWRLRSSAYYSYYRNSSAGGIIKNEQSGFYNTYLERDIGALRSTMQLGELSTGNMIQDPVNFRGVKLFTNDEMLRDNLRSYVPVVRGVANSQAVVTITQLGRIVYQTNVPAGPFELSDFNISGYSGDLVVRVREADGSEHSFVQPFSTLPEMKREGLSGFELDIGHYDNKDNRAYYDNTPFVYGSLSRGFSHGVTLFGETLQAENYQLFGLGSTVSLGELGAISGDFSISRAEKYNDLHTGQSYGFKYSKSQVETGTTVTLATYRYSTKDFYSFRDFVSTTESAKNIWENRLRNRMSLSLNQSLGEYGYLSLSASQQDYWTTGEVSRSASLSHSFSWNDMYFNTTFSLDQSKHGNSGQSNNKLLNFYVSIPLQKLLGRAEPTGGALTYSMTKSNGLLLNSASLSGKIPDSALRYRFSGGWGNGDTESNGGVSLDWSGDYFAASAGYTRSAKSVTWDYGLSGSGVIYPWGIALGADSVMNGAAIVETNGTSGVSIQQGGKTSFLGTGLVSSLQPYTENRIDLNPTGLPDDTVLADTSKRMVPVKGAVMHLDYKVYKGRQVIFNLLQPSGKTLPFGTMVSLEGRGNDDISLVGEDGRVYFAGVPPKGRLTAQWGKDKVCHAKFNIVDENKKINAPVIQQTLICE